MNEMTIAGTNIRRDGEGRYSLNDLHRAAGGEAKHAPSRWSENQQTKDLAAALHSKTGIPVLVSQQGGSTPGTYVAEQLVIAYASWISAEFHIEVLDTFLAAKKQTVSRAAEHGIAGPVAREYRALVSIAKLSGLKGNQVLLAAAQGTEKLTGTNPLALIGQSHLVATEQVRQYTPTELGQELGESAQAFNKRLEKAGLQVKNIHGNWQATETGSKFAVLLDTGKRHSDGTPVQQLKWLESVLDRLTDPVAA